MSVMIVVAMIAVPVLLGVLGVDPDPNATRFEETREEARKFLVHNPQLELDARGSLILDPDWLDKARVAAKVSESSAAIRLPTRMLVRSQAKLDELIELAYSERMDLDPAWRFGVLDARTPLPNYFIHAFVHDAIPGIALCIVVLLLVGAPLERSWGSPIFALFSVIAIPLTAYGYRLLDASSGIPWSGGAGLAAALLGAYCIRGLGGHFMLPGWVMFPVWLAIESLVIRGFWIDNLGIVPWASLSAAVGFGAFVAGALRLVGVESALDERAARAANSAPNPVISRAARLRTDGDPYQAFDVMRIAWRDQPADREVAEAFFSIAVEVEKVEAAAEAIVPTLEHALRSGNTARALDCWIPIASAEVHVELESTAAVRLGEALLDAGLPELAMFTLRGAVASGVSTSHALRIINVARDLDESLTRRAAAVALADLGLDPARRKELEPIMMRAFEDSEESLRGADFEMPTRISEVDSSGVDSPSPSSDEGDEVAESEEERCARVSLGEASPDETRLIDQNLDAGALSPESLLGSEAPISDPAPVPMLEPIRPVLEDSGDVLSHWNDSTRNDDIDLNLAADIGSDFDSDLNLDLWGDDDLDLMGRAEGSGDSFDENDESGGATDPDLTPLMEASGELTRPFESQAPADERTVIACRPDPTVPAVDEIDRVTDSLPPTENQSTVMMGMPAVAEGAQGLDEQVEVAKQETARRLRTLKVIEAVPIAQHDEWIDIEVDGRGKSKLPIARIECIVVAGISGLASRPVLIVDIALYWMSDSSEPLKVIRFRSDRFDPRTFEPAEINPLDALAAWVRRLQIRSEAMCLPSRAILNGQFARYDNVEDYESEVLAAMREL